MYTLQHYPAILVEKWESEDLFFHFPYAIDLNYYVYIYPLCNNGNNSPSCFSNSVRSHI